MYVRVDDRVTKEKKNVEIDGQLSAIQSNRQTNGQSDRGQGEYGRTDGQTDRQTDRQTGKQTDIRRNKQTDRQTEGHLTYRCQLLQHFVRDIAVAIYIQL